MVPVIYSAYNPPPKVVLDFAGEVSLARESEAAACDINNIMKRYEKTGMLPVSQQEGFFADVSAVGNYRDVRDRINQAEAFFMSLPAEVRTRFDNDAAAFLEFTSEPSNRDELVKMGLIEAPAEAPPSPPVAPAEAPGSPPLPPA